MSKNAKVVKLRKGARRGRGIATHTFTAACLAKELIDNYRVTRVKDATNAARDSVLFNMGLDDASISLGAVQRALRTINASPDGSIVTPKGNKILLALLSQGYIDDALSRLPRSAKSGNK
jgi:hypothetical protein